ncbi:hypothetical protein N7478_003050 [Penicillium angulare]|uniref:uncharacterized protein n=1 Tax=Penicillium angulare TaxID=116970 RepID=UPI00253F9652|nr:uncharacterized protein N7478_003050 [Penicillium angulare]KAJ5287364.1 hypothetical protein N7478_003050 [Penicillium angulare]
MGCSGDREKGIVPLEEKWGYVNLDDFKSESCWSSFSYIFIWIMLLVSMAVYGVDIFTAVNLLAFSRWSGRVEPAIPFKISRWIFAVCIIVSIALLAYRWLLAIRAMRSGSITRSYLDPLAVRVQSVRVFTKKGRGWKKFLVFADLTKSKKGAEYVALYTYFAFQSWMNTVFADGPRQVINAITLYSVMKMDLLPGGKNTTSDDGSSGFSQFFNNLKILAESNTLQAVVLFGMLFTLIIWVLSVLKLASAVILYLIFLFHHIPEEDGSLKAYCRRKISTRLKRIVRGKVDKALAKGLQLQDRSPTRPGLPTADSKPTLPFVDMDKTPVVTTLSRSTTETTLPPYTRSNSTRTDQNPTLPNLEMASKPALTRTTTQSSAISADSASLTANAAPMGYSPLDRQNATLPPVPPLPPTVPSRMASGQSRQTPGPPPFGNETDRGPAGMYRNLTDAGAQSNRTYNSANDPYAPMAPSVHSSSSTPGYYGHSHTPGRYDPYASAGDGYGADEEYENYGPPVTERDHFEQQGYTPETGYDAGSYSSASAAAVSHPQDPYQARSYTPASTGMTNRNDHYQARSYTPASVGVANPSDPYQARSYTPGITSTFSSEDRYQTYTPVSGDTPAYSQDGYYSRSYTPASTGSTPYQQDPYQARSYTPASTNATSRSQGNAASLRSMTPANQGTPAPRAEQQPQRPPVRTFTPMTSDSSTDSPSSGYTAFNPTAPSQTPQLPMPRMPPSAGYQSLSRAQTASPSTMNRNETPAGYSFNRANTDRF